MPAANSPRPVAVPGAVRRQVQSVTFDDVAHSVTVTGLGTDKGLPVTFVMTAVDSELLQSGLYSLVLSDGYSRSGMLTSGAVKLH